MFTDWEKLILQNLVQHEIEYWQDQEELLGEMEVIDGEIKILENIMKKLTKKGGKEND